MSCRVFGLKSRFITTLVACLATQLLLIAEPGIAEPGDVSSVLSQNSSNARADSRIGRLGSNLLNLGQALEREERTGRERTRMVNLAPLALEGGSKLNMVAAAHWLPVARKVTKLIKRTHSQYNSTFSSIPAFSTTVRLLDEEQFYRLTGAPRWTNAMYYRGEITIPLSPSQLLDLDNLYRSIKHEYTHAVVHSLSGGKCPGWLDEGIAQWAEGAENPALEPALRDWLTLNPPVPLRYLQGGFTKLQTSMVAPAYAQSLFAARNMIKRQGFYRIRRYLDLLRTGKSKAKAFKASFQISEAQYEKQLGSKLRSWALHRH